MFTAPWAQVPLAWPVSAAFTFTLIGVKKVLHWGEKAHTGVGHKKGGWC